MTVKQQVTVVVLWLVFAGSAASRVGAQTLGTGFTLLERELMSLMEMWPGDYNNREQIQFDADLGKASPEQGGHVWVHAQVRRVDVPALGPHVLYLEEYHGLDSDDIFRQRLYELEVEEAGGIIRLIVHTLRDPERFLGAQDDPSRLKALTRADTITRPGCDILIRRDGDAFYGAMAPKACVVSEGSKQRFADYRVRVTPDGYRFRERLLDMTTHAVVETTADFSWHHLERARWFRCMIDFPDEEGGRPTNTAHYVRIHDQGGAFPFVYPDGRSMAISLRNRWSYGMDRETLVVKVHDGGEPGPYLTYGWAEAQADWIGVNAGWIRVQCDRDTPRNRQLQDDLRPDS